MRVEVYRPFGRIVWSKEVPENRTHHCTVAEARQWAASRWGMNGRWWIRIV